MEVNFTNEVLKKDGETLEKQIDSNVDSKYNSTLTPPRQTYLKSVNEGWITPLISFDEYIDIYNQISGSLIGKTTVNGIAISEISAHFMERVIGTSVDPKIHKEEHKKVARSGMRIEDITYALLYGEARRPKKQQMDIHNYLSEKIVLHQLTHKAEGSSSAIQ